MRKTVCRSTFLCTDTGQLSVYDNNKMSLVSEVVTKEKLDFLHLAWSLDSTYLLSVTMGVSD